MGLSWTSIILIIDPNYHVLIQNTDGAVTYRFYNVFYIQVIGLNRGQK